MWSSCRLHDAPRCCGAASNVDGADIWKQMVGARRLDWLRAVTPRVPVAQLNRWLTHAWLDRCLKKNLLSLICAERVEQRT